jgi:hypothetical protein
VLRTPLGRQCLQWCVASSVQRQNTWLVATGMVRSCWYSMQACSGEAPSTSSVPRISQISAYCRLFNPPPVTSSVNRGVALHYQCQQLVETGTHPRGLLGGASPTISSTCAPATITYPWQVPHQPLQPVLPNQRGETCSKVLHEPKMDSDGEHVIFGRG